MALTSCQLALVSLYGGRNEQGGTGVFTLFILVYLFLPSKEQILLLPMSGSRFQMSYSGFHVTYTPFYKYAGCSFHGPACSLRFPGSWALGLLPLPVWRSDPAYRELELGSRSTSERANESQLLQDRGGLWAIRSGGPLREALILEGPSGAHDCRGAIPSE